jgi:adenylate cyclase
MNEGRVERRLAAILAVDVAGYSRQMGADEEGALAALRAVRRDLSDPKIREHQGRIVKTMGDEPKRTFQKPTCAAATCSRGQAERRRPSRSGYRHVRMHIADATVSS